jgi:hypothetical protein
MGRPRLEKLTADKPWSRQGHPDYIGYARYRRTLSIAASARFSTPVFVSAE